jgi:glycosyltransferase involved in cell wall biosynthesis
MSLKASEETRDISTPVVSVIIPSYNTSAFIAETMDSVLDQTFKDYEIIVVNDGAPDTEELERALEPYRGKFTYIKQENRGLAGARNTGLRAARGKYVAFLDSDDAWLPELLTEQVAFLEDHSECDIVYSDALLFGDTPLAGTKHSLLAPSEGEVTIKSLLTFRCNVFVSSVVAKRQTFLDLGLFDDTHRYCSEDWECWLRLLKKGAHISYQQKPLMRYRIRKGSLSANSVKLYEGALKALDKLEALGGLSKQEEDALNGARKFLVAEMNLERGKQQLLQGEYKDARENLKAASEYKSNWKTRMALLGLSVSPTLTRRIYLRLRA